MALSGSACDSRLVEHADRHSPAANVNIKICVFIAVFQMFMECFNKSKAYRFLNQKDILVKMRAYVPIADRFGKLLNDARLRLLFFIISINNHFYYDNFIKILNYLESN